MPRAATAVRGPTKALEQIENLGREIPGKHLKKGTDMTDYERLAQAAELRGLAEAARIRAHALEAAADRVDAQGTERVRRLGNYTPTRTEQRQNNREHDAYIAREVAAGRMCPGGCDRVVGGCFEHADRC